MQIDYATDIGKRRKNNQDALGSFTNKKNIPMVVVADGMGGHRAGDVASQLVVKTLKDSWSDTDLNDIEQIIQWLIQKIQALNEEIYDLGNNNSELLGMGTTVVAGVLIDNHFIVAHVGDSRAYQLRDGKLRQITDDHSLVNELYKSGEITAEVAQTHPQKNVLTRTVGMPSPIEVDVTDFVVTENDQYLLCSDGLTNMVSEIQITEIMSKQQSLKERVMTLIDLANEAGGNDNITVLIVDLAVEGGNV